MDGRISLWRQETEVNWSHQKPIILQINFPSHFHICSFFSYWTPSSQYPTSNACYCSAQSLTCLSNLLHRSSTYSHCKFQYQQTPKSSFLITVSQNLSSLPPSPNHFFTSYSLTQLSLQIPRGTQPCPRRLEQELPKWQMINVQQQSKVDLHTFFIGLAYLHLWT